MKNLHKWLIVFVIALVMAVYPLAVAEAGDDAGDMKCKIDVAHPPANFTSSDKSKIC